MIFSQLTGIGSNTLVFIVTDQCIGSAVRTVQVADADARFYGAMPKLGRQNGALCGLMSAAESGKYALTYMNIPQCCNSMQISVRWPPQGIQLFNQSECTMLWQQLHAPWGQAGVQ